jgi:hypothetical protein
VRCVTLDRRRPLDRSAFHATGNAPLLGPSERPAINLPDEPVRVGRVDQPVVQATSSRDRQLDPTQP